MTPSQTNNNAARRLIKIGKRTEIWTKQDTNENKQRSDHKDNHQQQQQQHTQHVLPTEYDRTHRNNAKHTTKFGNTEPQQTQQQQQNITTYDQ